MSSSMDKPHRLTRFSVGTSTLDHAPDKIISLNPSPYKYTTWSKYTSYVTRGTRDDTDRKFSIRTEDRSVARTCDRRWSTDWKVAAARTSGRIPYTFQSTTSNFRSPSKLLFSCVSDCSVKGWPERGNRGVIEIRDSFYRSILENSSTRKKKSQHFRFQNFESSNLRRRFQSRIPKGKETPGADLAL